MSIRPVSTENHEIRHSHMMMEANLRAGTTGVASTTSSISSASTTTAATASSGFCATISAWISSVVEGLRSCLARLPLIGCCFETTSASTTPASLTVVDPRVAADANLVNVVRSIFKQSAVTSGGSTVAPLVPGQDLVNFALQQFNAIQTDSAKWEAFGVILNADNSNDGIAKQFYDALPAAMQDAFKGELYTINGSSRWGHDDHGSGFGDFMVHNEIRHNFAKQAAANLQAAPSTTP